MKYEDVPEDVGYCFIFSVETLSSLYTEYCVNKEQNNYIIALPEAVQFFSVSDYLEKLKNQGHLPRHSVFSF